MVEGQPTQGQRTPQQYRQPAPQQYRQPTTYQQQQYQRQYYQRYPQYAPSQQPQAAAPPEDKKIPTKLIGVVVGLLLIIVVAFFLINKGPADEVSEEMIAEEAVLDLTPEIAFANNDFVFSNEILLPLDTNSFDVGDDLYIYSVFNDFEQEQTEEGQYNVEISYGVEVSEQTGIEYEHLSNPNLAIIRRNFDDPIDDYYFTARIPTISLSAGYYTLSVLGKDRITGKTAEQELYFELHEPLQLRVVTLLLGDIDPVTGILQPKSKLYAPGEPVQAYFEIRGFDVIDNAPDVVVDMYITDSSGNIVHDVSQTAVYVNNITYTTKPVRMMVNIEVPTLGLAPGEYELRILSKDHLAFISSMINKPFTIVTRD
ncbi:hypothetical protein ACFL96_17820 [Thermoproteota archaeon]